MKDIKIIWNLIKTFFLQQKRDKGETFWIYAFPIFLFILLGLIFGGVYDNDSSSLVIGLSQDFEQSTEFDINMVKEAFEGTSVFEVKYLDSSKREKYVLENDVEAFIHKDQDDKFILTISEKNQQFNSIISSIFDKINTEVLKSQTNIEMPIKYKINSAKHEGVTYTYIYFLFAGILAISLMQNALFSIPSFIISFRKMGFLKRFQFSPLKKIHFTLSIIIQRLITGLVQLVLLLITAKLVFNMDFDMNFIPFIITFIIGISTFIIIGFLITGFFKKAESANNLAQIINMLLMFTSGVYFPVAMMPSFLKPLVYGNPIYYYARAIYSTLLLNRGLDFVYKDLLILISIFSLSLIITLFTFKYEKGNN